MRLQQFRMYQRNGTFYAEDVATKRQESLRTKSKQEALVLLAAKNEVSRQPALNLRIARSHLAASDPLMVKRTWQDALDEIIKTKTGETQYRWSTVAKDQALASVLAQKVTETRAEEFLRAMQTGGTSGRRDPDVLTRTWRDVITSYRERSPVKREVKPREFMKVTGPPAFSTGQAG